MRFVATSASRDARNAAEFVAGVREAFGDLDVAPEVVAGDEEARFSFTGATGDLQAVGVPGPYLVVDLGGGSTELVRGTDRRRGGPLGRRRLRADDRAAPALRPADARRGGGRAARRRAAALDAVEETVDLTGIGAVVGLAGTITTITAHALRLPAYDPDAIHLARVPAATHARGVRVAAGDGARRAGRAALPAPGPGRRHRRRGAGLGAGARPGAAALAGCAWS